MNTRRNPAAVFLALCAPTARRSAVALLFCAALAGCRHRPSPYSLPLAAQSPVALEDPLADEPSPALATQPQPDFGPLPPANPPPPAQKRRPSPKEEATQPPAVSEPVPADLAIGTLSTGLDAAPQIQQQAHDIIASIQKRIASLSAKTAESQKREVRQVRHFLDQAQQALGTGDTEGAKNLATKAALLMDDLEKK